MGNLSIYYLSVSSHFKFSCLKLHHFLRNHFGRNMATLLAFSVLENIKDYCLASSCSYHSKLCRPHTVGGGPCHTAAPECCSSCPCSPVLSPSPHWVPTSLVLHTLEWVFLISHRQLVQPSASCWCAFSVCGHYQTAQSQWPEREKDALFFSHHVLGEASQKFCLVWWHTSISLAFRNLRRREWHQVSHSELHSKIPAILAYRVGPCLIKQEKTKTRPNATTALISSSRVSQSGLSLGELFLSNRTCRSIGPHFNMVSK